MVPGEAKVYTGGEATESRAKTEAPNAKIIQFATHGILHSAQSHVLAPVVVTRR